MQIEYTGQAIRRKQDSFLPCDPPTYECSDDWQNRGEELFVKQLGRKEFERRSKRDFPMPMPDEKPSEMRKLNRTLRMAKLLFGYKALMTGRRVTHMRGQGAVGTVTIVDKPEFPDHDFFRPGKVFSCRLRHANASFYDDASIQVRGCSLKFADSDYDSPLDVLMNSGPTSAFWNLKTFMDFSLARVRCSEHNWEAQKRWMCNSPAGYIGTIDAARHAPSSYTSISYYSKIAFPFKARDGVIRYLKYRIIPKDHTRESGLMTYHMQQQPWVQCRNRDDGRPRDYLKQEYRERVQRQKSIEYSMEIQVRDWNDGSDTIEFFNMNRLWDEATWPWLKLADVSITRILPDEITERMGMWLGHQPPSLGLTDAYSPVDYRSLCWARPQVYPVSQMNRSVRRTLGASRKMGYEF